MRWTVRQRQVCQVQQLDAVEYGRSRLNAGVGRQQAASSGPPVTISGPCRSHALCAPLLVVILPIACVALGACDPIWVKRIVAHPVVGVPDSTARPDTADAVALIRRLADRWHMTSGTSQPGYEDCYWRDALNLCARAHADSVEVRVQAYPVRWRILADSLRRELQDSLSARYGARRVVLRQH